MDPLYYSRIAMSGWVFLAVLLLSFWETSSYQWQQIMSLTNKEQATLFVGVFGAIVGIGGPPAFGFLLEKIVSVLLLGFKRNMWQYPAIHTFREYYDSVQQKEHNNVSLYSDGGLFHTLFYTKANENLLAWARRRRTHMYASFTGAASILTALIFSAVKFQVYAFWTILFSFVLVIALIIHGVRELRYHQEVIKAWVEIYGRSMALPQRNE